MAVRNCTGGTPAVLLSRSIRPAVRHGRLVHVLVGVAFPDFRAAASAWAALQADLDELQAGPGEPAGGAA
jgi:hypothetical protein